ncbi:MAG: hypothetical protein MJB14_05285 [Spirochaetes bacterium]|nr:hypothetical protein [Spirochaetota bacterium]
MMKKILILIFLVFSISFISSNEIKRNSFSFNLNQPFKISNYKKQVSDDVKLKRIKINIIVDSVFVITGSLIFIPGISIILATALRNKLANSGNIKVQFLDSTNLYITGGILAGSGGLTFLIALIFLIVDSVRYRNVKNKMNKLAFNMSGNIDKLKLAIVAKI